MQVNEAKTCLCLFHFRDSAPIEITLNGTTIKSSKNINVLGVIFDQKLQWSDHVTHCVKKSKKALTAIRLIRRFFTTNELLQLITSNFYSVLYYNSEIWHLNSLKANLKQKLLSSSAKAIQICVKYCTRHISFVNLHERYHRATPHKFMLYKHALSLYKVINGSDTNLEWAALNFNQILTSRQTMFLSSKCNNKKVGLNALANIFFIINNQIPLTWFNMSIETFKVHCKKTFILYE